MTRPVGDRQVVADLLKHITLLPTLDLLAPQTSARDAPRYSSSSYLPSSDQLDMIKSIPYALDFKADNFKAHLNAVLDRSLSSIAAVADAAIPVLDASRTEAAIYATRPKSGELGVTDFFCRFVLGPINHILFLMLKGTGQDLYWDIVGNGPTGKPDVQLLWRASRSARPTPVVVVEFKTKHAFPNAAMDDLLDAVADRSLVILTDGNTALRSDLQTARDRRPKYCRVVDQVRLWLFPPEEPF